MYSCTFNLEIQGKKYKEKNLKKCFFQDNEDKIMTLDDNKLLGLSGEAGDRLQYGDYMQKNVHLYKYRNSQKLTTKETANFMRFLFFIFFVLFKNILKELKQLII